MKKSYGDWNQYFIKKFFLEAAPQSLIRLHVSKEWFEAIPARDGQGGFVDFLNAMSEASQQQTVYDSLIGMLERQRRLPDETPAYVAYLVYLCLPWTWAPDSNNVRNYWKRLTNLSHDFNIDCGHLTDPNYHFSRLLSGPRNLLFLLRDWSQNNPDVHGEFVYCHLYTGRNDQISLLRSQVWPTDADLVWMPEMLFCHTDQTKELDEGNLGQFCTQEGNIQYAWPSFRNLFLSEDPLAQQVRRDALVQIYESYEDWVNNGRPVEKLSDETLRRIRDTDGGERRTVTTMPHLWLRLKKKGDFWEKTLFLNTSGFPAEREEGEPKIDIEIHGRRHECRLTRLPSGHFLIKEHDDVWNELALVEPQQELPSKHMSCGHFLYSPRKCYVMFQSSSNTFIQQDFATQGRDFYALYSAEHQSLFSRWRDDNNVDAESPMSIGDGWLLQHIYGLDENQCALFPNGLDNVGQSGLYTRLTGGLKARMGASFSPKYLQDFLPDIEAYLPSQFSVYIRDEYGNAYDPSMVLKEIKSDSEDELDSEEPPVILPDTNRYLERAFSITLPPDFAGSELSFQFQVNGEDYGRIQRVKLAPGDDSRTVNTSHTWDRFGDVVPRMKDEAYWPDTANEEETPREDCLTTMREYSRGNHAVYWKFIGQLRQAQGANGIPGKEFWTLVCANFRFVSGWRQQIQWLSDLGVLDIKTNEFGMWSRFYLNPPALCLLPSVNGFGELQAILSGAYTQWHIELLGQYFGDGITICEQQHEEGKKLPLLPPRVLMTVRGDIGIEMLKDIASKCELDWGGIPSLGFARLSVTLEEWLTSKQNYFRDGNPDNEIISGWYDMFGYRMLTRNAEGNLANPLTTCPELFNKCLSTHACPSIPQFDVSDLVNRERNYSVYIKDVPWGRWVSYLLEGDFADLRFKIAYHAETGTMLFPEALNPPRVLARTLTLCTGLIPRREELPIPYDQGGRHGTSYGLSITPYQGTCIGFDGVPRTIAECVAQKLHSTIKEF